MIFPVPVDMLDGMFPLVCPYIEAALEHGNGTHRIDDVAKQLLDGSAHLWVIADDHHQCVGAAVTEIVQYPRKKTIRVWLIGGVDFDAWGDEFSKAMDDFRQEHHADGIEATGRHGWKHKLDRLGYRQSSVNYWKE